MKTIESSARYLASNVAAQLLELENLNDDFISHLPKSMINQITGISLKLINNRCPQKKLALYQQALAKVSHKESTIGNILTHNLRLLTHTLALPEHCQNVLKLCVIATLNKGLRDLFVDHTQIWLIEHDLDVVMADIVDVSLEEFEQAIALIGKTALLGDTDEPSIFHLFHLPYSLAANMLRKKAKSYHDLLAGTYDKPASTELKISSFPHLELGFVSEYLKQAVKQKNIGTNILIYGEPGTGKTELCKVLAQYAKSNLVMVKTKGDNFRHSEDEIHCRTNIAHLRLRHYQLMQALFKPDKFSCLLLDECEDVFCEYNNGLKVSKDKLHTLLASNELPCFWITNHVELIPESVIRRFSYVVNVPVPPKHIKADILAKPLKGLRLSNDYKNELAAIPDLAPAHVVNASNIAKTLGLTGSDAEHCLNHHIDECLSACGLQTTVTGYTPELPFDARFINLTDGYNSIEKVIDTVTDFEGARCLLLGPPGTGKSALVHHLANVLEKSVVEIKPSDILSKYVGEAEQNVSALFKQALADDSIIFFDEVDSVLTSRASLNNQHERVLINEILLQLDRCKQTVFAATNVAHMLDDALLRRFDFKLRFDYLTEQQVLDLYQENFGRVSTTIRQKLAKLTRLTPGDFAIVARQNRLSKKTLSDSKNLETLTSENNRKIKQQAIGFVS